MRRIRSWVRVGGVRATATAAAALLIGMGLAFALERSYRAGDRYEAMTNRLLEGMTRSRGSTILRESGMPYGKTLEQIGLTREGNEETRRYHQEHLQELRWQNRSRIDPPADRRDDFRR